MTAPTYRQLRATGLSAMQAFREATHTAPPLPDALADFGPSGCDTATWTEDGWTVVAKLEEDYTDDLSRLGSYTDQWSLDVIRIWPRQRDDYTYFLPERTERQHYAELRQMHYGRTQARELARQYVQEDYRRFTRYGTDWGMMGVVVTVFRRGVELGGASVWGIESDSEPSYFAEMAMELASEALDDAKAKLRTLCRSEVTS